MTDIPDAAIEAAAERLYQFNEWGIDSNGDYYKNQCSWDSTTDSTQDIYRREASAAIEAAMPAIREALAQNIEKAPRPARNTKVAENAYGYGISNAASIVRGAQ